MNKTLNITTGETLGTQTMVRRNEPNGALVENVENEKWVKPKGGMWTSTFLGLEDISGWVQWGRGEGMVHMQDRLFLLNVRPEVKVLRIDTEKDLNNTLRQYGEDGPDWNRDRRTIDFVALKRDGFAGVNLTDEGQWATRFTTNGLYGWDCESTVWLVGFDEVFTGWEEVKDWSRLLQEVV